MKNDGDAEACATLPRGALADSTRCRLGIHAADIFPTCSNDCDDLTGSAGRPPKAGGRPRGLPMNGDARWFALGMDAPSRATHRLASMLEKNRLYRDCFALALAALVVFLSLALVSYDRADPVATPVAPFHLAYTPDQAV